MEKEEIDFNTTLKEKTVSELEDLQSKMIIWISAPGRKSHPKFWEATGKLQILTQELCRREIELTGGVTWEAAKSGFPYSRNSQGHELLNWAKEKQAQIAEKNDPLIEDIKNTLF